MKKKTNEEFINSCKIIHCDKYDYSKTKYNGAKEKIIIICPIHGEFEQIARDHKQGQGCPKCANQKRNKSKSLSNEKFIERVTKIYGDCYQYDLINLKSLKSKITIKCNVHGSFIQRADVHLKGNGCPKCSLEKRNNNKLNENNILEKLKIVHNDKYDYSKSVYKTINDKITIICPEHGEFEQEVASHLRGSGCPKCARLKQVKTTNLFITQANDIHSNKYEYGEYISATKKINIICPEHGEFTKTPNNHLSKKQGCPKCSEKYDKLQNEIISFLEEYNIDLIINDRIQLNGKELDIFIPSHNIAIEINGLFWHNEQHLNKNYHLNKTILCDKKNIQLIHIFEDEWLFKKNIVKSRLINILKLTKNKIYARNCIIKNITTNDAKIFLNNNHLQGNVNAKIKLGLYYNDNIVALMTFGNKRISLGQHNSLDSYELLRFCNILNTTVIGAANKLLKHFIKTYNPKQIISYADRRWSNGQLYQKLGFKFIHNSKPSYFYIIKQKRYHRFNFRKDILVKNGFDKNKTASQIMLERGIYRIYDCGTKRYELNLTV